MYKVKRKSEGNLTSQGITFEFGKEVVVTKLVYDYLKKTFPNDFEFVEEKEKNVAKSNKKTTKKKDEVVTK